MKRRHLLSAFAATAGLSALGTALPLRAQESRGPLKITITDGVIEPVPIAISPFVADGGSAKLAADIKSVIENDLAGTGLFRAIPQSAFISPVTSFDAPVQYNDWKAINASALVTGALSQSGNQITAKFRLYDVYLNQPMGQGLQLGGTADQWRRIAHKIADQIYSRITGEGPYFDSRVVFVSETGPKNARVKRLAIMDQDGANLAYLTDGSALVLAPRISPDFRRVLYTSYASGDPQIYQLDLATMKRSPLENQPGTMTFAPRYTKDGRGVIYSASYQGNTDIYRMDLASGSRTRLTDTASIETSPDYSPDGSRIVFESDRSGTQQLYIMGADGSNATRISFGEGRYATPIWSPKGDYIGFTKQNGGRFFIGVMRTDGSEERLLTASFLDESPTWSPNGRVIMFCRETPGTNGASQLYSVDITGRNLQRIPTPQAASDPAWSPLLT